MPTPVWDQAVSIAGRRPSRTASAPSTDEHGVGAGSASKEGALSDDPGLAYVVQALLDSRQSARDRSVYRSGMNKLARWAREFDVNLMAIDAADLEDFRSWVQAVGGSAGEILVIARRFVRLMIDEDMRRAVIRAWSSRSSQRVSTILNTDTKEVA